MSLSLKQDAMLQSVAMPKTNFRAQTLGIGDIGTSNEISGIEVRLSRVLVVDNRTPKVFPFPGLADIYLMAIVVDDLHEEPATVRIENFAKVDDGEELPVDRSIYYWKKKEGSNEKYPSQVHVLVSAIKSKKRLRNVAKKLNALKNNKEYKDATAQLAGAIASSSTAIVSTLLEVGGVVGGVLTDIEDKPLEAWVLSLTDINGAWDSLGKIDYHSPSHSKNVKMTISSIVKDVNRESKFITNKLAGHAAVRVNS